VYFRTNPIVLERQKSRILRRLAHLMEQARLYFGEERLRELLKKAAKPRARRQRKRNKLIKHFVATPYGGEWIAELLPKDDYADISETVPTVDRLLSKPVGYRLIKGFDVIRHGNMMGERDGDDD